MDSESTASLRFYNLLAQLDAHKRKLAGAVVVLALAALVMAILQWRKQETENAANRELLMLTVPSTSGELPPGSGQFLKVVNSYPGTQAANRARFLAAGAMFGEGKYAEAQAEFLKVLGSDADGPLASQAALGAAACFEAQGKLNEAAAKYQELISNYGQDPLVPQARLTLARIYEAQNKPEQALKTYDLVARPGAQDVWAGEAAQRREQLLAKFPNLAPVSPVVTTNQTPRLIPSAPLR